MPNDEIKHLSWDKEKEKLKLEFEVLTSKYSMFEETDKNRMSVKLQEMLAKTKEKLHRNIEAL